MTTPQPSHPAQSDPTDRFTDDELRDLLVGVLTSIRGGQPLDEDDLMRVETAVRTRR